MDEAQGRPEGIPAFSIEGCGKLADALGAAIKKLKKWEIRVADVSRLVAAHKLLVKTAAVHAFPSDRQQLRTLAFALRDASEIMAIVESLPDERLEVIATDLQRVVGGQLGQMAGKRTAFQFQSQFWAGAMLVGTGVSAVVPPQGSETRVDYLLMNGTINYGVEVKRPEKRETAGKLLRDAASQLRRAKLEGAVIMDLSDCFQEFWHSADVPRGRTEAGFDEMASELSSMIFDEHARKIQPGFENVLALMLTIRSIHWYEGQEQPDLMLRSFYGSFNRGPRGTLRYHRGVWLRNLMQNGLESWGYVSTS